jgi:hypothetical protein
MNGELHQTILLALLGQRGLAGDTAAMARAWPAHPSFQYMQSVEFREPARGGERVLAADPLLWLQWLREQGVTSLALDHGAPRGASPWQTAAFAGGGERWALRTSNGVRHDAWSSRLALDEHARDEGLARRGARVPFWRASYLRRDCRGHGPFDADADAASDALRQALVDIAAFAAAHDGVSWVDRSFAPALALLDGRMDPDERRTAFAFAAFTRTPAAGRMLDACQAAWVFGGMGSWNDGTLGPPADHERVTAALHQAIHRAIAAAVNSNG